MPASKFTIKTLSRVITNPGSSSLSTETAQGRLRQLTNELHQLERKLKAGGGPDKIAKQHSQGKLTARERIDLLLDKDSYQQEIGLLVAYDEYKSKTGSRESGVGKNENEIGQV